MNSLETLFKSVEAERQRVEEENKKLREVLRSLEEGSFCRSHHCRCGSTPEDLARSALEMKE